MLDDGTVDKRIDQHDGADTDDGAVLPEGIRAADYHLIEDAVMDTARGRWFMREYARRIRTGESAKLLGAIARLEEAMAAQANLIQKIHIQPASALSGVDGDEPVEPAREDAPASAAMLSADVGKIEDVQEKLLDLVWYMRERGFDGALCTAIRQEAGKLADIVHAQQPSGLVAEVSQSVACVREAGPAATSGEAMSREAMSRETMSLETMSLETMPLAESPGGQDVSDRRCAPVTEPAVGEGRAEGLQASPVRRVPDTAQPSKIAALAQKAAAFAPIDQLSEQEKLALFS